MVPDMIAQAEDRGEIKIDGETCKGGHVGIVFFFFILVGENALCHNGCTSLVIDLVWRHSLSSLRCKANEVFDYFWWWIEAKSTTTFSMNPLGAPNKPCRT
jgi:hypothetical protein